MARRPARVWMPLGLCLACFPTHALAYSYASPLAPGCHEMITMSALRNVRDEFDTAAPLPTPAKDRAWIEDMPLDLPRDARDLGAASLIAGVRDNDLKGKSGLDTAELAFVHSDPNAQREHCLRGPDHDEPDGSEAALVQCRSFIRERVSDAVQAGLDARGYPSADTRIEIDIKLTFVGETRVPMPRAYVQLGRALHALQDSFSHAVRSEDGLRVRSLLNFIDYAHEHFVEKRDGPAHRAALDHCEDLDPLQERRLKRAIEASTALLRAVLDPTLDTDRRLAQTEIVLDRYLTFEPGCNASNGFCEAPELDYAIDDFSCNAALPARRRGGLQMAWLLPLFVLWIRRWRAAGLRAGSVMAAAILLGVAPAPTHAQTTPPQTEMVPALAASSALSGSLDEPGAAAALGLRYRAASHWLFGADAEWNPWFSFETGQTRVGTFNTYATAIWRTDISDQLALRVSGHLGISLLLFDLYGAPKNSLGPYLGLSLLGLELGLSKQVRLILEPADVAIAIPHTTGIPIDRYQYRATVGLEVWLWP